MTASKNGKKTSGGSAAGNQAAATPVDAEKLARSLKLAHSKSVKHEKEGLGFSFDFGKLLQAYQVITQMIPLVKDLIALVKAASTGQTPNPTDVSKAVDRAKALGIE